MQTWVTAIAAMAMAAPVMAAPAHAGILFSDGFEDPHLPQGGYFQTCCGGNGGPTGWLSSGNYGYEGVFSPPSDRFASMIDGTQYAYIQRAVFSGSRLLRDAGVTIQAGAVYALTAAIGADLVYANNDDWQLELYDGQPSAPGSTLLAAFNAASPGAVAPDSGGWAFNTLRYQAILDGGELWVALAQIDVPSGAGTANFDAVTLSVSALPVPEPFAAPLLATLVCLGVRYARPRTATPAA